MSFMWLGEKNSLKYLLIGRGDVCSPISRCSLLEILRISIICYFDMLERTLIWVGYEGAAVWHSCDSTKLEHFPLKHVVNQQSSFRLLIIFEKSQIYKWRFSLLIRELFKIGKKLYFIKYFIFWSEEKMKFDVLKAYDPQDMVWKKKFI